MALVHRGLPVTLLDAGGELEPDRRGQLDRLRAMDPSQWRGDAISFLKHNAVPDRNGIGTKHIFGSDYPYRDADRLLGIEKEGCDTTASLAVGGFSSVWGATLLPYLAADTADWPFPVADLSPHYRAVLSFVDASLVRDDLAALFPLHSERRDPLRRSRQADALLRDLESHRAGLNSKGISFGSARVAVRASAAAGKPGCAYCGLCMYGCPNGLIYSADATLRLLEASPLFRRISGVIVDQLRETSMREVEISGRRRADGSPIALQASRVYLAAGAISSTRILLRSLGAYARPVTLRDSQYFLFPLLRYTGQAGVRREALHTLAQIFLEIQDPEVSPHTVHLQVYTYNDLYAGAMRKTFGRASRLAEPAMGFLLSRLILMQGYLHSDHSPTIAISLERRPGATDALRLRAALEKTAATDAMLRRVLRKVSRHGRHLKAVPLGFLLNKTAPGRGYHSGGTFPMRRQPAEFESDSLGRPAGFERVHVVDSTGFPSIPATTITFSVMANAHRIGTHSPDG
jgi:choline dehydrogenase-like flavoprotein